MFSVTIRHSVLVGTVHQIINGAGEHPVMVCVCPHIMWQLDSKLNCTSTRLDSVSDMGGHTVKKS